MRGRPKTVAPPEHLTPPQVAREVGLNTQTVYRDLRYGRLKGHQLANGQWLIRREALVGYRTVGVGQHFVVNRQEFRVSRLTPNGFVAVAVVREDESMSGWRERKIDG